MESSAENCRKRCQITNGCIGSSWWQNGGCHLSNGGELVDATNVTASACVPKDSGKNYSDLRFLNIKILISQILFHRKRKQRFHKRRSSFLQTR